MSTHRPLRFPLTVSALAVLAGVASAQGGGTITERKILTYTDSNLSILDGNSTGARFLAPVLMGPDLTIGNQTIGAIGEIVTPEIDARPLFYIPSYRLGKTGATLSFDGRVKVGINVRPWIDKGSLTYKYVAGVDLTYPRLPVTGGQATVTASLAGCPGSTYSTTNPGIGLEFSPVGYIRGKAAADAWFFGENLYTGSVYDFVSGNENGTPITWTDSKTGKPTSLLMLDGTDAAQRINDILTVFDKTVSPIPVGVQIAVPNLETRSGVIAKDGTLEAKTFSKFLSVQTDLAGWAFALLGPAGNALSAAVSGNYPVPATNYRVDWDFAKTYANLDVGLVARGWLRPSTNPSNKPKIRLVVRNAKTGAIVSSYQVGPNGVGDTTSPTQAVFTMPAEGVKVEPELDLPLEFRNRLAMGVGGEVGTEPLRLGVHGTLGSGTRVAPVDFDFSVGKYVWKPTPSEGAQFYDETFALRDSVEGRVRPLAPIGFNSFQQGVLPREVFWRPGNENPYPVYLAAYSYEDASSNVDNRYRDVTLSAEQGYAFISDVATDRTEFTVTMQKAGGGDVYNLALTGNSNQFTSFVNFKIPSARLTPGQHSIGLKVVVRNAAGAIKREASYTVPVTAYNPRVSASPQLWTEPGSQPNTRTNRIRVDGTDSTLYLATARGILSTTQVVLDGQYVLPNKFSTLPDEAFTNQSEGRDVGFTISAGLKQQLAGGRHTIKLRAPSLIRGSNGELLPEFESEEVPFYVVSGVPRIDNLSYNKVLGAKPPVRKGGYVVELTGANFSNTTVVTANGYAEPLLTEYSTPNSLRVTISDSLLAHMRANSLASISLKASTPKVDVEADPQNDAETIGGESSPKAFTFSYDRPALNRIGDPANASGGKVTLLGQETTVRVYGDNLYVPSASGEPTTNFTFEGASVAKSQVTYPAYDAGTLTVPYVDIVLPASGTAKARTLTAYNPISTDNTSTISISNEYAVPVLNTINGNNRIKILTSGPQSLSAVGGAVSSATRLVLGTSSFGGGSLGDGRTLGVTIPSSTLDGIGGKTVQAVFRNPAPGGGDSAPITVTLDEGNANKIALTKGLLTYDRASNAWKQEITVKYNGTHNLDTVRVVLQGLPAGVQLVNSNGTFNGLPFGNVPMKGGTTAKFVALFRVPAGTSVAYTAAPIIP